MDTITEQDHDKPPNKQQSHSEAVGSDRNAPHVAEAQFDPSWSASDAPADKNQVQHEFFLPGEGINPEVLKRSIRHHLGSHASIRVANYRDSDDSEITEGYAIMSYNTLTSTIVQKVKDESAREQPEGRRHLNEGLVENDTLRDNRRLSAGNGLADAGGGGYLSSYSWERPGAPQSKIPGPGKLRAIREPSRDTPVDSTPVNEPNNCAFKSRVRQLVGVHVCNECDPPRVIASYLSSYCRSTSKSDTDLSVCQTFTKAQHLR